MGGNDAHVAIHDVAGPDRGLRDRVSAGPDAPRDGAPPATWSGMSSTRSWAIALLLILLTAFAGTADAADRATTGRIRHNIYENARRHGQLPVGPSLRTQVAPHGAGFVVQAQVRGIAKAPSPTGPVAVRFTAGFATFYTDAAGKLTTSTGWQRPARGTP